MRICSRSVTNDFGNGHGAAAQRVLQLLDNEDARTLTHDEAVAVAIEGA